MAIFAIRTAAIGLLWSAALAGQEQAEPVSEKRLKGLSLEQLGNIEVTTVSKQPVKVARTPAAIHVITQEDIRRSGITTFPEVLRLAPGVEVARIDSVKWSIGIRGFGSRLSRALLVLIDGRSVYSPLFHGVYWEVQDTLLEDIERIEVIRGPGGTIWGANAVNGVINIITRSAKDTQGTYVSVGGGSLNQAFTEFRQGGAAGRNLHYRVYGKGFSRGPEFHFNNRQFDDWRRGQAGFRADWDASHRDTVTVQGDLYGGVAGESTRITEQSPPSARIAYENADLSGGNVMVRWNRALGGGSDFQLQTYYDRVNRSQSNQAEYRDTFDVDFVHHLALPAHHDFTWGVGARVSPGRVPAVVPTFVFTPDRRTDQLYSGFLQDEIPLVRERLSLTIGSKLLHSSFTGFDAEPSARLIWTPDSRQSLWAAFTRAVRTPSDLEDTLQSTSFRSAIPPEFNRTSGDREFTSETLAGFEAGYRNFLNPRFSMDVAVFYNRYNHLLSLEPGASFIEELPAPAHRIFPFVNRNGLEGTTAGFEIVPNWKPTEWWRLEGSYAYLHMDLRAKPGSLDVTSAQGLRGSSPGHQVVVQSFLDLPGRVEFSQAYRYVTALPAQSVASYHTADSRLAWRPTRQLELSLVGQNLLQPHHPEYGGNPGPNVGARRNVFAAITWRR